MVRKLDFKKIFIIALFWFIGWILCGATVAIGRILTTMQNTMIVHAILAPIFFWITSFIYHKKFNYSKPLETAGIFTFLTILIDAAVVAPIFEKSYEMFTNILGTWLVFILIFISTYLSGLTANKK